MERYEKLVYFDESHTKGCYNCKYENVPEEDEPCDECLRHHYNVETRKPVKWEAKE